jgi:hypothetical protein
MIPILMWAPFKISPLAPPVAPGGARTHATMSRGVSVMLVLIVATAGAGLLGTQPVIRSKIPSHTLGILHIFLAVVFSQELFFAQDLTVEQPNAGHEVNQ